MNLEREVKLAVGPLFHFPDLAGLADGLSVSGEGVQRFVTSYYDTEDLALARWGCSLRYRTGEGWMVKLPESSTGAMLERQEHHVDAGPGRPPAAALDLVRAYVRHDPVSLAVRLQTVRRPTRLLDPDGSVAAEIVDDEVSVLDGRRVVARFRELEVELAPETDGSLVQPVLERLRAEGAQLAEPALAKHVRALEPRSTRPPDVTMPADLTQEATVADMVGAALSSSVVRLLTQDAVVRLGEDPEGVHQARVATRRLRSDLRTFRSFLDPDRDTDLREELRWLGGELGAVRDLDVLGERLRTHALQLPDQDAVSIPKLFDRLRAQREEARAALLSAMREDRYVALLDRLVAAANEPPVLGGDRRAIELAEKLMAGPWGHLRTACRALGPGSADQELHAARIRTKRVRYASEALAPVIGKPARRFAKQAAQLQQELGEHQDSVFAATWLRAQATGTTARVAFSAGVLAGIESRIQRLARRRWPEEWAALDRKKLRFWR